MPKSQPQKKINFNKKSTSFWTKFEFTTIEPQIIIFFTNTIWSVTKNYHLNLFKSIFSIYAFENKNISQFIDFSFHVHDKVVTRIIIFSLLFILKLCLGALHALMSLNLSTQIRRVRFKIKFLNMCEKKIKMLRLWQWNLLS